MTRSKDIGTRAETAVARYLQANGFPAAERRALHGNVDLGDITGTPGVAWEVKGGEAAKGCGPALLAGWMQETEAERVNSHSDIGLLVIQRRGFGLARPGGWHTYLPVATLADLILAGLDRVDEVPYGVISGITARIDFADAVVLLRRAGYGEPL